MCVVVSFAVHDPVSGPFFLVGDNLLSAKPVRAGVLLNRLRKATQQVRRPHLISGIENRVSPLVGRPIDDTLNRLFISAHCKVVGVVACFIGSVQ